jgi:glyoxalase family protein
MENKIIGLHHITAIATNAQKNLNFYRDILGLRFIKKTVNFDDPSVYHLYYGNQDAEPGSVLTFFPWEHITKGRRGTGQATEIGFSVPHDSFDFWLNRFKEKNVIYNVIYNNPSKRFDDKYLTFLDPDGLKFELTEVQNDSRNASANSEISKEVGIKGFSSVAITSGDYLPTAEVLTDIFGYKLEKNDVNRFRYINPNISTANVVDLVEAKGESRGVVAGGSVHHVSFRVKDEETHSFFREKIFEAGLNVTEQIDRQYFKAIYFREPGGVLFEVSTDTPGFFVDESEEELGKNLKLPPQYETRREEISRKLPKLT